MTLELRPFPLMIALALVAIATAAGGADPAAAVTSQSAKFDQCGIHRGVCVGESGGLQPAAGSLLSVIECAVACASDAGCLACAGTSPQGAAAATAYRKLMKVGQGVSAEAAAAAAPVTTGSECTVGVCENKLQELLAGACPLSMINAATFLVELNATWSDGGSLSDFLCSSWCRSAAADANQFVFLGETARERRCAPLAASVFFAGRFLPLAVSVSWRATFKNEICCTQDANTNVPPLMLAAWAQTFRQLDICAQACVWRDECEFFIFNATGCYEGTLSLYLNSRLASGEFFFATGCSVCWHKARSWASSMLAYYTFNSSMLNLANPAIMPAVNNSPVDVGPDGFQVPTTTSQYVKLNLTHIGFDSLVRSDTPITFLVSFTRTVCKTRSELMFFADCANYANYNGAINEQPNKNSAWFVNTLTGNWQQADSVLAGSTITYPDSSPINFAVAMNASTAYFVINGKDVNTSFWKYHSTFGSSPAAISCMYLGFNHVLAPSAFLNGRIKVLGIFKKMLTVNETLLLV